VLFQLKELEDEITYLEGIDLLTIDHSAKTKVAVSTTGEISLYNGLISPVSAVDQGGNDRLMEITAEDGMIFKSTGPGYLIITFPLVSSGTGIFGFSAKPKGLCRQLPKEIAGSIGTTPSIFTVEFLDANGNWVPGAAIPTRERATQGFVSAGTPTGGEITTIRLSWDNYYETDVIYQLAASSETPGIQRLAISECRAFLKGVPSGSWDSFEAGTPVVLTRGDMLELSFVTGDVPGTEVARDYVIRAVGRYQPNYGNRSEALPGQFQLYGNRPNPFNPTIRIDYALPTACDVRLTVYNILGQTVRVLVDGYQDAGFQTVVWDGKDGAGQPAASGIYLYRIEAGNFTNTKKMVLMK